MLPIKKLYIDSRFKSPDSASDSDFYIDLPQTLLMPEGTGFYLDDISIPVSWYPIEKNRNNKIYVELYNANNDGGSTSKAIEIEEGSYSVLELSNLIANAINVAFSNTTFYGTFSVTSSYSAKTETITLSSDSGRRWAILTDAEIKAPKFPSSYQPYSSINSVLQNTTPKINTTSFTTGYINIFPIRNIYITSFGLGNFNTMSISGDRGIVKKVPVTGGYGEFIFDQTVVGIDYLDCSKQTLSRIGFRLNNVFGERINLHGQHWSFSIVFSRIQEIL